MIKLTGQIITEKIDSFVGSEGKEVKVKKIEVLDLGGTVSQVRTVTDYDLKNVYKVGSTFDFPVSVRPFVTKNGIAGIQFTRPEHQGA